MTVDYGIPRLAGKATGQNYSAARGAYCPHCHKRPDCGDGSVFYLSPYAMKAVGWSEPPFSRCGSRNTALYDEVAMIFECQACFEKFWFHLDAEFLRTFREYQAEWQKEHPAGVKGVVHCESPRL